MFYFLCISCSYSSYSLRHPSLGIQYQLTHHLVKSSTLLLKKMLIFQGVASRHTIFTSSCVIPLWDSATTHLPSGKESFLSGMFLRAFCFVNLLTWSCLGSLWFGTYPFYLLNPYVHLYYVWSISMAKDRHYPKYFILCVVYFYSKRQSLCREE